jgi:MoaA/NifB/PqqE/SkfB family radical SAM enzyme
MNEHFCSLPWVGIDISAQGGIKPCCKYDRTLAYDLDSYLSSPDLIELQQQFLQGERPLGCRRCWQDEDAGLCSKRQLDHEYVLPYDVTLDSIKILAMTFGNTCNLSCVTCGSNASSRWAAEERKIDIKSFGKSIYPHNQFYRDPVFRQKIAALGGDLIHLEIAGGEPFYASAEIHKNFLLSLPNPGKIKIHYITNATVFPELEFWEIWKRFRHVDIQLSIDGVGKKFEYLRYPAEWQMIQENITRYQEKNHIQLSISHTVSWMNILYIGDFFSWCHQQNLPDPYLGPVSKPNYLSIQCLPLDIKTKIRDRLETSNRQDISALINYMYLEDQSDMFDKGQKWLSMLDTMRGTVFADTFPELNEFIQNA